MMSGVYVLSENTHTHTHRHSLLLQLSEQERENWKRKRQTRGAVDRLPSLSQQTNGGVHTERS